MYKCDFNDYFGNKAVGRNAIQKIRRAWQFERDAFIIHKKNDLLEYRIPDMIITGILAIIMVCWPKVGKKKLSPIALILCSAALGIIVFGI